MNTKYGKLVDGRIVHAPEALETASGIKVNPTEASYRAAGWKRIVDDPPAVDAEHVLAISSYTEGEDAITVVYKVVAKPKDDASSGGSGDVAPSAPTVKVYSKLAILDVLKKTDMWVLVKTWMEEKAYYDYYLAATNFAADNPLFLEGVAAFRKYTGKTDAEIQAVLDKCIYTP